MSFFYNYIGDFMKLYLDYIFLINFLFDFILLLGVSLVLKRNTKIKRLFIGSLVGAFSFFFIFFNISSFLFLILKLISAFFIVIVTFSYKSFSYTMNNFFYLIILSLLMGGCLYLVNIEIGYSHVGMLFFTNGKGVNLFILIIIGSFLVLLYSKYMKKIKRCLKNSYKVIVKNKDKSISLNGFLDTGNELFYYNKPVLILNKDIDIDLYDKVIYYVPFTTVKGTGVFKCIKVDEIVIEDKGIFKNVFVALSNDKFHLKGADIILNMNLWEDKDD